MLDLQVSSVDLASIIVNSKIGTVCHAAAQYNTIRCYNVLKKTSTYLKSLAWRQVEARMMSFANRAPPTYSNFS